MINTYIISGLVLAFFIGLFQLNSKLSETRRRLEFLTLFRNKFIDLANDYFGSSYVAARAVDYNLYNWLILNLTKAQNMVGVFGVGIYVAPYSAYQINNCQFISHILPHFGEGKMHETEVSILDNVLLLGMGYYLDAEQLYLKAITNPIKWFQYGIRFIVGLPMQLFNWLGVINDKTLESFTTSGLFKIISGLIAFISLVSSVIGLITGWQPFIDIIHKAFPGFQL